MARPRTNEHAALFLEALFAARFTHKAASKVLGVSARTIGRYVHGRAVPPAVVLERLARAVAPMNGALAQKVATAAGVRLDASRESAATIVEVVVCAMASAMDVSPNLVRPGILAAYDAAQEHGISFEAIATTLRARKVRA